MTRPVGRGRRGAALAGAVTAAMLTQGPVAGAQLRAEAERLAEGWRAAGANVVVDKARFLNNDERIGVPLPLLAQAPCTTVVFLGARSLGFHVDLQGAGEDGGSLRVPSAGGVAFYQTCGGSPVDRAAVSGESGRGAFETVVGRSASPLPPLRTLLPERTEGRTSPQPDPGALPPLPSQEKRAELSEVRARRDGATIDARLTWKAGADGKAAVEMTLGPGCHTLILFAPEPVAALPRRGKLDLDAELRDSSDDHLLARDQTDAPDARLSTCVGDTTRVDVVFVGAPAAANVLVSHASRRLPDHLPGLWGAEVRARMAQTLLARRVVSLPSEPFILAQGGAGAVPVPLPLEPGACYVAVAALVEGAAHGIGLTALVQRREAVDSRSADESGAAVALCAGAADHGLVEVETRGASLVGWGLAVYRIQSGIWGTP